MSIVAPGSKGRLNFLTSENKEMQKIIENITAENRHLRQVEIRQAKTIKQYEKSEYSVPGLLHHHQKQVEGLKEQVKKYKDMYEKQERRSRVLEEDLSKKSSENDYLKKMMPKSGTKLKDAEMFKSKSEDNKQKVQQYEKEIQALKKHIGNLEKNHKREILNAQKKEKEMLATLFRLQQNSKGDAGILEIPKKEAPTQKLYMTRKKEIKPLQILDKLNQPSEDKEIGKAVNTLTANTDSIKDNNSGRELPTTIPSHRTDAERLNAVRDRLKSYDVNMQKIRLKNKNRISELRNKLDVKLGPLKDEIPVVVPYDTLKNRSTEKKKSKEDVSKLDAGDDFEPEIANLCQEEDSNGNGEGDVPKRVADYVLSFYTEDSDETQNVEVKAMTHDTEVTIKGKEKPGLYRPPDLLVIKEED